MVDISGTWKNTHGSLVDLSQKGQELTGTYQTAVGLDDDDRKKKYDLKGWVVDDGVSWLVNWAPSGSLIASFCGLYIPSRDGSAETLQMSWHLVRPETTDDRPKPLDNWERLLTGSDHFQRKS